MHSKRVVELIGKLRKYADCCTHTSYVQIRSKASEEEQASTLESELHLALQHITNLQKQKTTVLDQMRELIEAVEQMQIIQISEHECLQNQLLELKKQLKEQNIDYEKCLSKNTKELEQLKFQLYQKDQQINILKQDLYKKSSQIYSITEEKKNIEANLRNNIVQLQQKYLSLQQYSSTSQMKLKNKIDQLQADLILIETNLKNEQSNKIQLQKSYKGLSQQNQKLKTYYENFHRQVLLQNSSGNNDTTGKLSDDFREPQKLRDYLPGSYKKVNDDAFKDISCWDSQRSKIRKSFITRGQLLQDDIFSADKQNFIPNGSTTRDLKLPNIIQQVSAFRTESSEISPCPYYSFFILTIQCLKINSKKFQLIAQHDLRQEWENILNKRIPLNQWQRYLKNVLEKKVGFKV